MQRDDRAASTIRKTSNSRAAGRPNGCCSPPARRARRSWSPHVASLTAPIKAASRNAGVGHVLRHSPLRRPADLPARGARRRLARLSSAGESVGGPPARLAAHGVTHISGTPSHWRRVLDEPGGADDRAAIRPALRRDRRSGRFSTVCARSIRRPVIGHAYASTEAGVGFEVDDGREGFPAASSCTARRRRAEGRGRFAADPLARGPRPRYLGTRRAALARRRRLRRHRRHGRAARRPLLLRRPPRRRSSMSAG